MARQMRGKNREKILEAGFDLFYERGFEATGVQEIAAASSVPKGSFYNYFSSKTDFATSVLQLYCERQSDYLQKNLIDGDGSPLARLKLMFETWSEMFFAEGARGCLVGNMCQELANNEEDVRAALHDAMAKLEAYYTTAVRAAQDAGEISESLDAEDIGAFLFNGWQGAMLRAKATRDSEPFRLFIDLVFEKMLK